MEQYSVLSPVALLPCCLVALLPVPCSLLPTTQKIPLDNFLRICYKSIQLHRFKRFDGEKDQRELPQRPAGWCEAGGRAGRSSLPSGRPNGETSVGADGAASPVSKEPAWKRRRVDLCVKKSGTAEFVFVSFGYSRRGVFFFPAASLSHSSAPCFLNIRTGGKKQ